ncbi:metallophosphoesterase [Candidatus Saccharibacteria bacterium]|nr:metallophosphoesterase [Candidatus Saccharibacteria bacterium]
MLAGLREPIFCRTARYTMESPAIERELKVALTGDWHVSPIISERQRQMLERVLTREKPDIVILQGDLIDEPKMLDSQKLRRQLIETVRTCTKVAPTIGVLGNHDIYRSLKDRRKKRTETPEERERRRVPGMVEKMREALAEGGAKLLTDETFCLLGVEFYGFERQLPNTEKSEKKTTGLKWFIGHAPFQEPELREAMWREFDVASFGHTHGGCLPIGLDALYDKLGFHGGLVTPEGRPFPKDWTRGMQKFGNGKQAFFNAGMVATQFVAPKPTWYLNCLKRAEVTVIEIKLAK